jgi:hypothetical protein
MRITVWMMTRERRTWLTGAQVLVLGLIVVSAPTAPVRLLIGLPLVVYLGYQALTSLPLGLVPRRKEGGVHRRRYDLRSRVVRFLDEVRRVEDYADRARISGLKEQDVEEYLNVAQRRVMSAAASVAQATGRWTESRPFLDGTLSAEPN